MTPLTICPSISPHISSSRVIPVSLKVLSPCITFHIRRPQASSLLWTSIATVVWTSSSNDLCTAEPWRMAGVGLFLPCFVSENQYCSSHQDGETRSVTDKGFLGLVRNRSIGERVSGTPGGGFNGASIEAERSRSARLSSVSTKRFSEISHCKRRGGLPYCARRRAPQGPI